MCPGDELGRNILFMFGARLVAKYSLEVEGPPDLAGVMGLTLAPPPYQIKLIPIKTRC